MLKVNIPLCFINWGGTAYPWSLEGSEIAEMLFDLKHEKQKTLIVSYEGFVKGSLAVTYFHTGIRTIIGATSFHGPVRNGKGWVQRAMAAKHNW